MAKSKLRIIYRSNSHAPLWLVAAKSGAWEKNGLDVDTSPQLVREKAVEALKNGHVDLISGNHHNLYVRNAKNGEDFVHLAQATNNWTENNLVVRPEIRSVRDLRGKKIAADKLTSHAGLNIWLFLKQEGLNVDRGDIEMVELRGSSEERWQRVLAGEFAGTFVTIPHDSRAAKAGARNARETTDGLVNPNFERGDPPHVSATWSRNAHTAILSSACVQSARWRLRPGEFGGRVSQVYGDTDEILWQFRTKTARLACPYAGIHTARSLNCMNR